jgi:hypothetical protein
MVFIAERLNYRLCPEGNKKGTITSIRIKLKDKVGMAGPKSTCVGIIISTIHPYACYLSSYTGRRNKSTSKL